MFAQNSVFKLMYLVHIKMPLCTLPLTGKNNFITVVEHNYYSSVRSGTQGVVTAAVVLTLLSVRDMTLRNARWCIFFY